jgi:FkbM family methyltransferase
MKNAAIKLYEGERIISYEDNEEAEVKMIVQEIFNIKNYEAGFKAIKRRKNPVILDIGAHIGLSAIYFSQIKGAKIYAFEPSLAKFKYLKVNTLGMENVKIFNYGIGGDFSESRAFGKATLYPKEEDIEEAVKVRPIDYILSELKIPHVDLLKIDVEGAEYEILFTTAFGKVADKVDFIIGEAHYGINLFLPVDIPPFLDRYKFKTKFLPYDNYVRGWEGVFGPEKEKIVLKYLTQTMFFSKKI